MNGYTYSATYHAAGRYIGEVRDAEFRLVTRTSPHYGTATEAIAAVRRQHENAARMAARHGTSAPVGA
jgi:hypothetical protein